MMGIAMNPIDNKRADAYPESEGASARDAGPLLSDQHRDASAAELAAVKRIATVMARLALAGFSLFPLADGSYVVARWNLSQHAATLTDAEAFTDRLAAHHEH